MVRALKIKGLSLQTLRWPSRIIQRRNTIANTTLGSNDTEQVQQSIAPPPSMRSVAFSVASE